MTAEAMSHDLTFEGDGAIDVRIISPADLAASRTWIDNWKRMMPCLVVTRGLLGESLLDAVEHFVASSKHCLSLSVSFLAAIRFSRAEVFGVLYEGRIAARELRVNALSPASLLVSEERRS